MTDTDRDPVTESDYAIDSGSDSVIDSCRDSAAIDSDSDSVTDSDRDPVRNCRE